MDCGVGGIKLIAWGLQTNCVGVFKLDCVGVIILDCGGVFKLDLPLQCRNIVLYSVLYPAARV